MPERVQQWGVKRSLGTFAICLALTTPIYAIAVRSYGVAFWEAANSEMKGWLFILFPMLAIPPLVPWLKIAIPASIGFSLSHPIAKVLVLVGALFFSISTDVTGRDPDRVQQTGAIGTMSPVIFKFGIWVLVGVGALVAQSAFERGKKPVKAETDG